MHCWWLTNAILRIVCAALCACLADAQELPARANTIQHGELLFLIYVFEAFAILWRFLSFDLERHLLLCVMCADRSPALAREDTIFFGFAAQLESVHLFLQISFHFISIHSAPLECYSLQWILNCIHCFCDRCDNTHRLQTIFVKKNAFYSQI